jgi:hypothetical protein
MATTKRDWIWVKKVGSTVVIYGYTRRPPTRGDPDGGIICYRTFMRLTGIKLKHQQPRKLRFAVELIEESEGEQHGEEIGTGQVELVL